jgi:hypothetical protein
MTRPSFSMATRVVNTTRREGGGNDVPAIVTHPMQREPIHRMGCDVNIGQIEQIIEIEPVMEPVEAPDRHREAEPAPLSKEMVPA